MSRIEEIARTKADRLFFDDGNMVLTMIANAGFSLNQENARIVYAILKLSAGDTDRLAEAIVLAETDWRDLLVAAELANEGWEQEVLRDI